MASVSHLMDKKSDGTNYTVESSASVLNALEVMADANISAVMVVEEKKIIGIFTERDYTRKGELKGQCAKDTLVKGLMTEEMLTVSPATSIDQCMELMNQYKIRHLPVVADGVMVGMVSIRDVVEMVLADRDSAIIGRENYIIGSGFST